MAFWGGVACSARNRGEAVSVIDELLAVQERDLRILRIDKELEDIPARKENELTRLNEHKEALKAAEEALKLSQAKVKELELATSAKQEQIAKLRAQQLQLKTNREFKAMELEIKALEDAIRGVEDRELALMEEVESAVKDVAERRRDLEVEDAAVQEDITDLDERSATLASELEDERVAREVAASTVDSAWLGRYDSIFRSKQGNALVQVKNGVCGGCHMQLPPYVAHDARKQLAMVSCDFCGRLLY